MVHCHRKDNWSPFENWFLLCFVLFRFLLRESFMATPPCRQRRIPLSWALLIMLSYSRPSVRCPKTHMKNPREFVLLKTTEFSFIFPVGNKLTNFFVFFDFIAKRSRESKCWTTCQRGKYDLRAFKHTWVSSSSCPMDFCRYLPKALLFRHGEQHVVLLGQWLNL